MGMITRFRFGSSFFFVFLLMLIINADYNQIQSNAHFTTQNSEDIFVDYGYEYLGGYDENYNEDYYPELCYPMNDLMLVAANNTLEIINLADYSSPDLLGTYKANTSINSIVACKNYVYLTKRLTEFPLNDGLGFEIIDIQDPANPKLINFFDNFSKVYDKGVNSGFLALDKARQILFVANDGGLGIVNVSDVTNPVLLSEIEYGYNPHYFDPIQYVDNVLYVLLPRRDWSLNGMVAFNVSSPSSPSLLWGLWGYDYAASFYVSDNYLYVNFGKYNQSLYIYEIYENKSISLISSSLCDFYTQMLVKENVGYFCRFYRWHSSDYLRVVNVTNKESLEEIFTYNISASSSKITNIAIYSNKLFISETETGTKYFTIPYCPEEDIPYCDFTYTKIFDIRFVPIVFTVISSFVINITLARRKKSKQK